MAEADLWVMVTVMAPVPSILAISATAEVVLEYVDSPFYLVGHIKICTRSPNWWSARSM